VLKARVVMLCTVAANGGLENCSTQSEDPAGYGYGAAMLKLAPSFRLSLWSTEGLPTIGGRVSVPIRFDLSDAPATKP
jgi:protein TonB